MKVQVFVLVMQSFFTADNVEYACAVDPRNIQVFATYDEAIEEITWRQKIAEKCGYHTAECSIKDEIFNVHYSLRMENSGGRAMVLKVISPLEG